MIDLPGEHPEPPKDLASRNPLVYRISEGTTLFRFHNRAFEPLFFGRTARSRFDSPDRAFGVLYVAFDEHCAFIESFAQDTGVRLISATALEQKHLAHLTVLRALNLIDLSNTGGLARIGADSRLFSGSHAIARRWSKSFRDHPIKPDGILYPARHDPARKACAILDCPPDTFQVTKQGSVLQPQHSALLGSILDCYDFGIVP